MRQRVLSGIVAFIMLVMTVPGLLLQGCALSAKAEEKYALEEICTNPDAFRYYVEEMWRDLFGYYNHVHGDVWDYEYSGDEYSYDGKLYHTDYRNECTAALVLLNDGMINDDILLQCLYSDEFGDDYNTVLKNGSRLIEFMFFHEINRQTKIDFSKYTLDNNYGAYLNQVNDAGFEAANGNQENLKTLVDDYFLVCSNDYNCQTCPDQNAGMFLWRISNDYVGSSFSKMYVSLSVLHRHTYGWIDQNYSYLNTLSASDALLGDVNRDTFINASDAAQILIASAKIGSGGSSGLTETQFRAADVNADSSINASDAAFILQYAAAVGGGYKGTLPEFLADK